MNKNRKRALIELLAQELKRKRGDKKYGEEFFSKDYDIASQIVGILEKYNLNVNIPKEV